MRSFFALRMKSNVSLFQHLNRNLHISRVTLHDGCGVRVYAAVDGIRFFITQLSEASPHITLDLDFYAGTNLKFDILGNGIVCMIGYWDSPEGYIPGACSVHFQRRMGFRKINTSKLVTILKRTTVTLKIEIKEDSTTEDEEESASKKIKLEDNAGESKIVPDKEVDKNSDGNGNDGGDGNGDGDGDGGGDGNGGGDENGAENGAENSNDNGAVAENEPDQNTEEEIQLDKQKN